MKALESLSRILNQILTFIAGLSLAGMILLTCGNIFLRTVWTPIKGTFELLGFMGAVATAFALAYTQIHKMHISVDILVDRFSDRTRRWLTVINGFLCLSFFGLSAWQITKWSNTLLREGEVTETLRIVFYPFTYATALGCAALALVFLVEVVRVFSPAREAEK